jgi:hypothetical protein
VLVLVKYVDLKRGISKDIDYCPGIITSRFDDIDAFFDNHFRIRYIIWRVDRG